MPVVIGVPAETAAGVQPAGQMPAVSNDFNADEGALPKSGDVRRPFDCRRCRVSAPASA